MPKFSKRSLDNLLGVHPKMIHLLNEAIKTSPVDFTITDGVRTSQEQIDLYAIGRRGKRGEVIVTKKDGVKKKSNHQPKSDGFGYAVDLYPYYEGKVQVTGIEVVPALQQIAQHIKERAAMLGIKVIWGGDWNMRDLPHFELAL